MILNNSSRGLLKENNQILFIEYNINGEIIYNLPGGSIEAGENLRECVIREFLEETGISIDVENLILLNEFISPNPNSISEKWKNGIHQIEAIFKVEKILNEEHNPFPKKDLGMQRIKWMSKNELKKVKYFPEMPIEWFFNEKKKRDNIYHTKRY